MLLHFVMTSEGLYCV